MKPLEAGNAPEGPDRIDDAVLMNVRHYRFTKFNYILIKYIINTDPTTTGMARSFNVVPIGWL